MSQSYISQKYDDFFEKMLTKQNDNNMISEPIKQYSLDSLSYTITSSWKNKTSGLIFITTYTFDPNDVCVYIYQFTLIEDDDIRKEMYNALIELFNYHLDRRENLKGEAHWIEHQYKINVSVKHTIEDKTIDGKKGIAVILEQIL